MEQSTDAHTSTLRIHSNRHAQHSTHTHMVNQQPGNTTHNNIPRRQILQHRHIRRNYKQQSTPPCTTYYATKQTLSERLLTCTPNTDLAFIHTSHPQHITQCYIHIAHHTQRTTTINSSTTPKRQHHRHKINTTRCPPIPPTITLPLTNPTLQLATTSTLHT